MKVTQEYSDRTFMGNGQPWRLRIEGKDGQAFDIVEQMGGGFTITGIAATKLVVMPLASNAILIEVKS